MSTTGYANAPIDEFGRRGDRLYKGHFSDVYDRLLNAPIAEFSRRCDRTNKNYENLNF
ncbi:MAG: hypothetical protein V7K19_08405 [Nostoc sp.]